MTSYNEEQGTNRYGTDPTMDRLQAEVASARARLEHVIANGERWPCPHCGLERDLGPPPWNPSTLREAAGVQTNQGSIAMFRLIDEGWLVTDSHWMVKPGDGTPVERWID